MNTFILATEAAADFVGDDLQTVAYVLLGVAMLIAAIATAIVAPGREHHDH